MNSAFEFLCFALLFINAHGLNTIERRCQAPEHINCVFLSQHMEVWCDKTNLTDIPDPATFRAYAPAEYAKSIFMNNSCLQVINAATLRKYTCLRQLDFDDNELTELPSSPFSNCLKLNFLRLSHNHLCTVRRGAFAGLTRLQQLHLNHNEIESLPSGTFSALEELRVLTLNDNLLQNIPKKLFLDLLELDQLDLSRNRLHVLDIYDLRGLPQLRSLNLEGNGIQKIDEKSFLHSPRLQRVDLRHNNLSCLHHDLFKDSELTEISMDGNNLRTPKPDWFRSLTRNNAQVQVWEGELVTDDNEWLCDCDAIPYLRFLLEEIKDLEMWVGRLDIRCSEPAAFAGEMLSKLTLKDIHRQYNESCDVLSSKSLPCGVTSSSREPPKDTTTTTRVKVTTTTGSVLQTAERQVQTSEITPMLAVVLVVVFILVVALVVFAYLHLVRRKSKDKSSEFADDRTNRSDGSFTAADSQVATSPSPIYDQVYSPQTVTSNPDLSNMTRQNSSGLSLSVSKPSNAEVHRDERESEIHYACMAPGTTEPLKGVNKSDTSCQSHHYHSIICVQGPQPYLPSQFVTCPDAQGYFNLPAPGIPPAPVSSECQEDNASST